MQLLSQQLTYTKWDYNEGIFENTNSERLDVMNWNSGSYRLLLLYDQLMPLHQYAPNLYPYFHYALGL